MVCGGSGWGGSSGRDGFGERALDCSGLSSDSDGGGD